MKGLEQQMQKCTACKFRAVPQWTNKGHQIRTVPNRLQWMACVTEQNHSAWIGYIKKIARLSVVCAAAPTSTAVTGCKSLFSSSCNHSTRNDNKNNTKWPRRLVIIELFFCSCLPQRKVRCSVFLLHTTLLGYYSLSCTTYLMVLRATKTQCVGESKKFGCELMIRSASVLCV